MQTKWLGHTGILAVAKNTTYDLDDVYKNHMTAPFKIKISNIIFLLVREVQNRSKLKKLCPQICKTQNGAIERSRGKTSFTVFLV